ncbi:glycosyltransferase [Marinitoga litoralis]|uniref:glycosyltransferase n=1 Tax=Marinitoga litoralis TaxID=570855 RepID=UPI0019603BF3|nr:glycosyltransferase family 2 protein [Marinitoga litoralis]MBM7559579.1 glycosyltransferase involved in cell wall biosynthesis [Marinitoga litoralis]
MILDIFFYISFIIISFIFIYFGKNKLLKPNNTNLEYHKISVIIPARNEEKNISKILKSIINQSYKPYEIIVVDDSSTDKTPNIVKTFKDVKLIRLNEDPPKGWNGKTWAIWNGYKNSTGDYLLFLDADVELSNNAIEILINKYMQTDGLISVWPYQKLEKFYEHLVFLFNIIIVHGSNMIRSKKPSGAFGPVILTSRKNYELTGGHEVIKDSVLEDIKLGKLYVKNNINVSNYLGNKIIKFRMYPNGISQLFEGFTKNISSGSTSGGVINLIIALIWISAIFHLFFTFKSIYLLYYFTIVFMLFLISKNLGDFKWYDYFIFPVHLIFFAITFFYSLYRKLFLHTVIWKGRNIDV